MRVAKALASRHQLVQVANDPRGGWSAVCSCGRWGYAGAPSKRKLVDLHREHVQEAGGGR
jgi:hypothetical protein